MFRYFLRFPKRYLSTHRSRNVRGKLIRKYGKCVLTGWSSPLEFQAAHIVPRHVGHALNFPLVNHSTNCILLSNSLHSIFDDMVWSFDMMNIKPVKDKVKVKDKDADADADEDQDDDDDLKFKTKIVIRPNYPVNESILSMLHRKKITVPAVYIPSLYLHYMVFIDLQKDGAPSITELYRKHIESDTYKDIRTLNTEEYIDYLQKNC